MRMPLAVGASLRERKTGEWPRTQRKLNLQEGIITCRSQGSTAEQKALCKQFTISLVGDRVCD